MPTAKSVAKIEIVEFARVREELGDATLLLGNGFSIACDTRYSYRALRKHADDLLPAVSRALLDRLDTNNLEQVMQIVEDARWVAEHFEKTDPTQTRFDQPCFDQSLADAHRQTCLALVKALAVDHLQRPGEIDRDGDRSSHAVEFLGLFERVFTTNYDLLLYWTMMRNAGNRDDGYNYRDGFRRSEAENFGEFDTDVDVNVFFLHGALHLYEHRLADGEVRARKMIRGGRRSLVEIVKSTLDGGDFPLFVAGGRPEQKLETIRRSPYLAACFDAFSSLRGPLVIFGWSLGDSDRHLLNALADNPELGPVYLSFHGDPEGPTNLRLRATAAELSQQARSKHGGDLRIALFPSEQAGVWG